MCVGPYRAAPPISSEIATGAMAGDSIRARLAYLKVLLEELRTYVESASDVDWSSAAATQFRQVVQDNAMAVTGLEERFAELHGRVAHLESVYADVSSVHESLNRLTLGEPMPGRWK